MTCNLKFFVCCVFSILYLISNPASAQNQRRSIHDLTADTSGWGLVKQLCKNAKNQFTILPVSSDKASMALTEAQVTTRSPMGAIIYFTGGILIDHGWIRILGSGSSQLGRTVMGWNKGKSYTQIGQQPAFLLVADDAAGGFFAINGGALGDDPGKLYYLSPDNLQWQALGIGYTDFIAFCLNGDLNTFYKNLRWKNWIADVQKLPADQVYSFYPFLWSEEGSNIENVTKKPIPVEEQYQFNMDSRKQLAH